MRTHWSPTLVEAVHRLKAVFAFFSRHQVLGIPLDWPVRFGLLAFLYLLLRRWLAGYPAAGLCLAILLAKELFDVFATRGSWFSHAPDGGDAADILSGVLGLAAGAFIYSRRRGLPVQSTSTSA